MVRQTSGRRADNNNSGGTADRGARGGGGMARKTVFRPTVRAPPIGASPTIGGNSGEPLAADTTRSANSGRGQGGGSGLLLVNRKPAAAGTSTTFTSAASNSDASSASLGPHSNSVSQDQSQAKNGPSLAVDNPWAVRSSQRQAAVAAAATVAPATKHATRPTAAMLNGRRHPQATDSLAPMPELDGYDDAEGKQHWDEMLDKGFDYSQDIEFGDGTAVRINSRTRSKLPLLQAQPQPSPTPAASAAVESQIVPVSVDTIVAQPNSGASQDPPPQPSNDTSAKQPATHASSPAPAELPLVPHRAVETSWGKPTKPAPEASADGAAAPASARWWKASLSSGSSTVRPPQQQQQQSPQIQAQGQAVGSRSAANSNVTTRGSTPLRAELSDGNSSGGQALRGGRSDRGPRPARGSRRQAAPIPTVVPPVLLRRPTQPPPTTALEELCLEPVVATGPVAVVDLPVPPTAEDSRLTDSTDSSVKSAPPANPKQNTRLAGSGEAGPSAARNLKKTLEPGSKKPSGASNSVENWRTATAPRPPALQAAAKASTANVAVAVAVADAGGPVEAMGRPTSAARRRSTGAARMAGGGQSAGSLQRPAAATAQQDKPERGITAGKLSAAATATSWRADPSRAKPVVEASSQAPAPEKAHDVSSAAGRQRAQTQGATGASSHDPSSARAAEPSTYSGPAGGDQSQLNGLMHVSSQTFLPSSSMPPPLLPQSMLADLLGKREGSAPSKQPASSSAKPSMPFQSSSSGAAVASQPAEQREGAAGQQQHGRLAYGGAPVVPSSSASLFNVEGSPLMGSSNAYGAPVRPVFGHADPGLFTWQGSHMGFHDTRARQEYLLQANPVSESSVSAYAVGGAAPRELPARWSNAGDLPQQQQVPPPPGGMASAVSFSSFATGAGMLWLDPSHMVYDPEGRSFRAPIESRPSSHGETASGSGSASGAGSNSSGPRGYRAPGRAPRPIGTRSAPGSSAQRNTRSRQGVSAPHQQPYVHGTPSPVGGQRPLFVPASHMHQSWLPHYSLMQPPPPPAYGNGTGARFGRTSPPHHSPQMTATPQPAGGSGALPASSAQGVAPYMVPMMAHQPQALAGGGRGAETSEGSLYMPEAFRPSPPPPPMYTYGYAGGAPSAAAAKQGKAGQMPLPASIAAAQLPHYHHGYPPQLTTGAPPPPHMGFVPMYMSGEHGAIGGNSAYYYGPPMMQQPFGNGPLGQQQYQSMPMPPSSQQNQQLGFPAPMTEAQKQGYLSYQAELLQQNVAIKQAEKLLGISRSSSTSTRGHGASSKAAGSSEPLQHASGATAGAQNAAPLHASGNSSGEAGMARTASASKTHASGASSNAGQSKPGGERPRQRGGDRRNERKPAKPAETVAPTSKPGEPSPQPRQQQQRQQQQQNPDAKRMQQQKQPKQKQPKAGSSSGPREDAKPPPAATTGQQQQQQQHAPGDKPARRGRGGNRSGRGEGAKKAAVTASTSATS
ncbi:hypothetical protein GGI20_001038 [Coemansia sp. BCRC 34301]|nr:hypothetical protein GGI20_001038 [Coemansia sp. BCRC 34301]